MSRALASLSSAKLPRNLWGEMILTETYIKNRTLTSAFQNPEQTPHERWNDEKPDLSHMREIGCHAFVLKLPKSKKPKIFNCSVECVMIGYSPSLTDTYCCYDRKTGRIHLTRNVEFIESHDEVPRPLTAGQTVKKPVVEGTPKVDVDVPVAAPQAEIPPAWNPDRSETESEEEFEDDAPQFAPQAARPTRTRKARGEDAVAEARAAEARAKARRAEAKSQRVTVEDVDEAQAEEELGAHANDDEYEYWALAATNDNDEPKTWKQAQNSPFANEWREAYQVELDSIKLHGVYELVPRESVPTGRKIIRSRPVFKIKRGSDGEIQKFKARLVSMGYAQVAGQDYRETYAPTSRFESFRMVLHAGTTLDYEIDHIDVKTAFHNGLLEEEIWQEQPKGFEVPGKEQWVWKLKRGMYGLKQGSRSWNRRLHAAMTKLGFKRISVEYSLYSRRRNGESSLIAVHVDDLCVAASSKPEMRRFKDELKGEFEITDLGPVKWILGIRVTRDRAKKTISLDQQTYIEKMAARFGLENAHPIRTPMVHSEPLSHSMSPSTPAAQERMSGVPYRELVGSLMYANVATCADIAHSVGIVSQFCQNPGELHWLAAKRILRYLIGTKSFALILGGDLPIYLTGFTDSNYAPPGDLDKRKSTSGYCMSLGGGVISWSSKRQSTVATSSTEAEYMACCHAAKEAVWLRMLLHAVRFLQRKATDTRCDNQGALILTADPSFHSRAKHIDVQYHFSRDRVERGELTFTYVHTSENMADIFTKSLPEPLFRKFRTMLGIVG
ncbi:Copia protein [Mycena venus]|uniref:Copia protein n=1 Tax=Mycena venus TaxID=2733690 RepID=A0A8H6Z7D0_9AGAR|nr:Copia protein [Mycena venus]